MIGNKYFKEKEYELALKYYYLSLEIDNFSLPTLTNIAQAYIKLTKYNDGIEFCNRALRIQKENVKALCRR